MSVIFLVLWNCTKCWIIEYRNQWNLNEIWNWNFIRKDSITNAIPLFPVLSPKSIDPAIPRDPKQRKRTPYSSNDRNHETNRPYPSAEIKPSGSKHDEILKQNATFSITIWSKQGRQPLSSAQLKNTLWLPTCDSKLSVHTVCNDSCTRSAMLRASRGHHLFASLCVSTNTRHQGW